MHRSRKFIFAVLAVVLLLAGCSSAAAPTTLPATTAELTTEPASTFTSPSEIEPVIQPTETASPTETTSPLARVAHWEGSHEGYIVVYIARCSVDWFTYSIAPAGSEDWIPLERMEGTCSDDEDDRHHGRGFGGYYVQQYRAPYDGDETVWRLRGESIPEVVNPLLGEETEYAEYIWEDIHLIDDRTVLQWFSHDGESYWVVEELEVCPKCPKCWFESSIGD